MDAILVAALIAAALILYLIMMMPAGKGYRPSPAGLWHMKKRQSFGSITKTANLGGV
jgi:hypothetical protein